MAAPESPDGRQAYQVLSLFGSEIAGFAIVGVLIDYACGTLKTFPWATLIFTPLGLVVALWHLIRIVRRSAKP